MKRFAPIAAIAVGSLLLAGCQSKRDICAEWAANEYRATFSDGFQGINQKFWDRLGIPGDMADNARASTKQIGGFCEFYKS